MRLICMWRSWDCHNADPQSRMFCDNYLCSFDYSFGIVLETPEMIRKFTPLLLLVLFATCEKNFELIDDYEVALNKWQTAEIEDYEFLFSAYCFCPPNGGLVVVKSGEVVAVLNRNTRQPEDVDLLNYPSIDELFSYIGRALDNSQEIEYSFNGRYGYPFEVAIDRSKMPMDAGVIYKIGSFKRL